VASWLGGSLNWFIVAGGVLWVAGAVKAFGEGNWRMGVVSLAYAVSQFVLAGVK
jgi:hypothetical protein